MFGPRSALKITVWCSFLEIFGPNPGGGVTAYIRIAENKGRGFRLKSYKYGCGILEKNTNMGKTCDFQAQKYRFGC